MQNIYKIATKKDFLKQYLNILLKSETLTLQDRKNCNVEVTFLKNRASYYLFLIKKSN